MSGNKKSARFSFSQWVIAAILLFAAAALAYRWTVFVTGEATAVANNNGEETAVFNSPDSPPDPNDQATAATTPLGAGLSRANPIPHSTPLSTAYWEVERLEMIRGYEALRLLHEANSLNEPPPEGWEYLLVRYRLQNKTNDEETSSLGLHVTGNRLVTHFSFNADVVPPDPILQTDLAGGATSEGWTAYRIYEEEGSLMVIVEDYSNYEEPTYYMALNEGASISVSQALVAIEPTLLGSQYEQPLPFSQVATAEEWQLSVLDVITGEAAWELVYEANQFNDPPEADRMYVLVRVRLRYIGLAEGPENIDDSAFKIVDSNGREYDAPSVVEPRPALDAELFPGGEATGWIVLQAPQTAETLVMVFNPPFEHSGLNRRYFSLVESGR